MAALLAPFVAVYSYALQPVAPFTWLGLSISALDVVAAFRLCLILRQVREMYHSKHVSTKGHDAIEGESFAKKLAATYTVVYGGEALAGPMLGLPPSFMISGAVPALYAAVQAFVEQIPSVNLPSFSSELPLSVVDGFTRAFLLCTLVPPAVTSNASPVIASSPWSLLMASLVIPNTGFFIVNLVSMLHPTTLSLRTPPELQAYGWTTADIWCAPVTTGLYALLTHAQPFWADLHTILVQMVGGAASVGEKGVEPLDPETARALCALVLATLFSARTVKTFKPELFKKWTQIKPEPKEKTQ
ncbi:hypothetical protein ONZ45_g810 [Pleurotus djamor]|nr:hypothetical protein ONZ45_g810 [Pleurotus djamor]